MNRQMMNRLDRLARGMGPQDLDGLLASMSIDELRELRGGIAAEKRVRADGLAQEPAALTPEAERRLMLDGLRAWLVERRAPAEAGDPDAQPD
jgi:hypothetical protein